MINFEVILPTGRRVRYSPRASVKAANAAASLARKHKLPTTRNSKGRVWYFRGPLGEVPSGTVMKNVELAPGECLKLESKG